MDRKKYVIAAGIWFSLMAVSFASAWADSDNTAAEEQPGTTAYYPQIRSAITSPEVARNNLAELLSGNNEDVPGIKVPGMPATCTGTSIQALHSLGQGGPSHAAIACIKDQVIYAFFASMQVTATAIRASNEVSVNFADLLDSDLGVREVPKDQAWIETMKFPFQTNMRLLKNRDTPDGRPISTDFRMRVFRIALKNGTSFHFQKLESAAAFADNLLFIQSVIKEAESERQSRFDEKLSRYRAGDKPPVTEDQRRLLVQANLMTQRKNYAQALDLYRKALDIDPVAYPEAYFNSALLSEQLGRYTAAIEFMKKYLLLLPNGKDARQAQDKIYEWELLGGVKP
jgi:hypothetical protein